MNIKRFLRRSFIRGLLVGLALLINPAKAATFALSEASITDINAAFKTGVLTSEKLTQLYLARITAFDQQGPKLNAVITLNPKALDEARALDAERKAKGPRGPLHGIPVLLKDNFDTTDLPNTAGFFGLKGHIPSQDATLTRQLRAAGAIILAKVNLSEFASGSQMSSLGGQSLNPHALDRTPAGSSGGTGVAIAAYYAPLGYGTDTGGSIRGPSTVNGIVGLKPTHGLLSRAGIIPLALSFDTGGPMARSVTDIALSLNATVGQPDPRDDATQKSVGHIVTDYTKSPALTDLAYLAAVNHGLPFVRDTLQALFETNQLDAIVYPTNPRRPALINPPTAPSAAETAALSPTNFANLSGFPDLIIPAGFTTQGLPVGISFFGPAWSEPKLLSIGYAYEQATKALRVPVLAPALPGETITY